MRCTSPPRRGATGRVLALLAAVVLGPSACRESSTAPSEPRVTLGVVGSSTIHTTAYSSVPEPIRIVVLDAERNTPVSGVPVEWRVLEGASLGLEQPSAVSDEFGVASVRISTTAGSGSFQATAPRMQGSPAVVTVTVVERPVIESLAPGTFAPGDVITLTGRNFGTALQFTSVLFDGVRGTVLDATAGQVRVRAPACLPHRPVQVRAAIGYAQSEPASAFSTGSEAGRVTLGVGESQLISDPAQLACIQLTGDVLARYLIVAHNAAAAPQPPLLLELRAIGTQAQAVAAALPPAPAPSFAEEWEGRLRARERALRGSVVSVPAITAAAEPAVGDRRDFNVLNSSNTFDRINATVRAVSSRAVLFVDNEATGAFGASDLQYFGDMFDDPIYATNTGVFGAPSDIDGNGRVLILFTPRVNALTPRGSASFITGFFYGCDLVARSRCSGTNQSEVFYSMVPDAAGQWGDSRSVQTVRAAVPPVLAHEFQHMIHFARRGFTNDVLWLSEALAHMAEEIVAEVFDARLDEVRAQVFRSVTRSNARQYLSHYRTTSLLSDDAPGSTPLRGGAWLLLMHLRAHYGGNDLLGRLTSSTRTGVSNVVAETGTPWLQLISDFGVAVWADGAPDGASLKPEHSFNGFRPRDMIPPFTPYPVQADVRGWTDFATSLDVPAASQGYAVVNALAAGTVPPLNFVLSGRDSPIGAQSGAALTILRLK